MAKKIKDENIDTPVMEDVVVDNSTTDSLTAVEKEVGELPEHIKKILKRFPKYEELDITAKGCIFEVTKNIQGKVYKNPYYKKH